MFPEIVHVTSGQSRILLTWTHYRELLRVEDPKVHAWYEREAADQGWNVGVLSRNISSQYCEHMLSNHVKPPHGKAIVPSAAAKCQSVSHTRCASVAFTATSSTCLLSTCVAPTK